jgi:hypothetical protein
MRALLLLPVVACLLAPPAGAGPWPREPGRAFVSAGAGVEDLSRGREPFAEVYGEYGLTPRLTLGAVLRHRPDQAPFDLFARWHPALPGPLVAGLTLGARLGGNGKLPVAPLVAAHVGHGAATRLGNLWARADLRAAGGRDGLRGGAEIEASAQFGLRAGWGGLAMVTLSDHRERRGRTLKLIPALGYSISQRSTLVLGATLLPRSRRFDGAHLSVWAEF